MRIKISLTLLLVAVSPAQLSAHELYLSITNIQHQRDDQKLSIQVRLLVNDLEESILQQKGVQLGLWKNTPIDNAQDYVEEYICSRLLIYINELPVPLDFIGLQIESAEIVEDHVIICELEAYGISEISSIRISNSLLIETIDDQVNITNILANKSRKTINLSKRIQEEHIVFITDPTKCE